MTTFAGACTGTSAADDRDRRGVVGGPVAYESALATEWIFYVVCALPGALLAFVAWQGLVSERTATAAFAVSFIGLNVAHLAATCTHVYLDADGWRGALLERTAIPLGLVLLALAVDAAGGWVLLLNAQLYLSIHHAEMQNYGIARASQRRSGRAVGGRMLRLDQAACLLGPLAAWMWRCRDICDHYRGAPMYAPPPWLIVAVGAAGVAALVTYAGREAAAWIRGERVDPVGPAMVIGINALWTALLLTIPHPLYALYAIASAHYVQYLYFVWNYQSRRPGLSLVPDSLRVRIAPPAQMGYLVSLIGIGLAVIGGVTLATMAMRQATVAVTTRQADAFPLPAWSTAIIAVNFAHYWLDSRIWRSGSATRKLAASAI